VYLQNRPKSEQARYTEQAESLILANFHNVHIFKTELKQSKDELDMHRNRKTTISNCIPIHIVSNTIHNPVEPVAIKSNQAASLYPALAICSSNTGNAAV